MSGEPAGSSDDARFDARLDALLAASRPPTAADDGWADSVDGADSLDAIRANAQESLHTRGLRIRLPRTATARSPHARPALAGLTRHPARVGVALTAAAALAVGLALALPGTSDRHPSAGGQAGSRGSGSIAGPKPSDLALVGYDTCSSALTGLRDHVAARVTSNGLPYSYAGFLQTYAPGLANSGSTIHGDVARASAAALPAPVATGTDHSGTNDQEAGADEPDIVKTDGKRIVTVSGGTLRVVDAASRKVTGTFDLGAYSGGDNAQLLMSGDRALVLLGPSGGSGYGGFYPYALPSVAPATSVLLVDLAKRTPRVVSLFRPRGTLLDARLVDGTARLVVRNSPDLTLHRPTRGATTAGRLAYYRAQVQQAPLKDWLPSWSVTSSGDTTAHTLGCADLSHPAKYTGLSLLTVYSVDPSKGFDDVAPIGLAADGGAVYASTSSLYVASDEHPYSAHDVTQLHRFDISRAGRPTYLGSGSVRGGVEDSYSLSEYDGALRVVTSVGAGTSVRAKDPTQHDVWVLDAATLKLRGHVGGIGRGEQLHAVRFLGGLGYVVTFRQIDPLFVLDLRDPDKPTLAGTLTVTGYSGYLHDVGDGRLLGIGQSVTRVNGRFSEPDGLQVSLFDVAKPSAPGLLSRFVRARSRQFGDLDPHAFLYWPQRHLAVVPYSPGGGGGATRVMVVRVGARTVTALGSIANPSTGSYDDGIQRSFYIGDSLWTLSGSGLAASDASTLRRQAWLPNA